MIIMRKNGFALAAAIIFSAVLCGAAIIFLPAVPAAAACVLLISACAYFALYFFSLKYYVSDNTLYISGGIIFRKTRILPLERVLWRTRLTAPFGSAVLITVLHTAGGGVVIFSEPPN